MELEFSDTIRTFYCTTVKSGGLVLAHIIALESNDFYADFPNKDEIDGVGKRCGSLEEANDFVKRRLQNYDLNKSIKQMLKQANEPRNPDEEPSGNGTD